MKQILKKQNGQALVETLYSLPLLALGVSLVMGGLHSLFVFYLTDYWTFQAALCLAQEVPQLECKNRFVKNTNRLPMSIIEIQTFQTTPRKTQVTAKLSTHLIHKRVIDESITLPLNSRDFRRSP